MLINLVVSKNKRLMIMNKLVFISLSVFETNDYYCGNIKGGELLLFFFFDLLFTSKLLLHFPFYFDYPLFVVFLSSLMNEFYHQYNILFSL